MSRCNRDITKIRALSYALTLLLEISEDFESKVLPPRASNTNGETPEKNERNIET